MNGEQWTAKKHGTGRPWQMFSHTWHRGGARSTSSRQLGKRQLKMEKRMNTAAHAVWTVEHYVLLSETAVTTGFVFSCSHF